MFSFLSATDKRIAYAPSFGVESVETRKVSRISQLLNRFSHISVREKQGLSVLQQLGISTDRIPVVLDPTLLLSPDKWQQMLRTVTDQEPYILCYFLASNNLYWEAAKKLADKLKMKVVVIPEMEDSLKQPFEIRLDIGPKEWVGLVNSAGYVLTDSFHCVLFSLVFHKQFCAWKRYDDNDSGSQNSRLQNILENVGLADRLLSRNTPMCTKTMTDICTFAHIDAYMEREKRNSINWLVEAIDR